MDLRAITSKPTTVYLSYRYIVGFPRPCNKLQLSFHIYRRTLNLWYLENTKSRMEQEHRECSGQYDRGATERVCLQTLCYTWRIICICHLKLAKCKKPSHFTFYDIGTKIAHHLADNIFFSFWELLQNPGKFKVNISKTFLYNIFRMVKCASNC